ncbi:mitotic-spindle organizing protein 2B-like [Ptychodera flava]|uniref:mitotic-spindle organizing protein 2B-like n=1 Tax=Ptychodera flava TaxID=63121 RepID=UPI00396A89C7
MSAGIRAPTQTYKYTITTKKSKSVLSSEEEDLYELCQLAGISLSLKIYRIILDMIRMNIGPHAILQVIKSMCKSSRYASQNATQVTYRGQIEPNVHLNPVVGGSSRSHSRSRMAPHS